ncbi:MAG: hypothetical protein L0220_25800 [Acidobacteria bacterium]|nr:hypothetical protein [Acidobacteriota bacterium]
MLVACGPACKLFHPLMFNSLFSNPKPIIGMIHVGALPGTPAARQSIDQLIFQAEREAAIYRECRIVF